MLGNLGDGQGAASHDDVVKHPSIEVAAHRGLGDLLLEQARDDSDTPEQLVDESRLDGEAVAAGREEAGSRRHGVGRNGHLHGPVDKASRAVEGDRVLGSFPVVGVAHVCFIIGGLKAALALFPLYANNGRSPYVYAFSEIP